MFIQRLNWAAIGPTALFVLLWSAGAIFSKWGLEHASAFAFLLLRFVLACAALGLLALTGGAGCRRAAPVSRWRWSACC